MLAGQAPECLLDSYDTERGYAADENIRHSTRSTDFITPKSNVSRIFRDAVLGLAKRYPFARALVNSGRLSLPATLFGSPLNTADSAGAVFAGGLAPGAVAVDAPVAGPRGGWLLGYLDGGFTLLCFGSAVPADAARSLARDGIGCAVVQVGGAPVGGTCGIEDSQGLAAKRYDALPGTCYLLRPDQHVCARWRAFELGAVRAAIARATAQPAQAAKAAA